MKGQLSAIIHIVLYHQVGPAPCVDVDSTKTGPKIMGSIRTGPRALPMRTYPLVRTSNVLWVESLTRGILSWVHQESSRRKRSSIVCPSRSCIVVDKVFLWRLQTL